MTGMGMTGEDWIPGQARDDNKKMQGDNKKQSLPPNVVVGGMTRGR